MVAPAAVADDGADDDDAAYTVRRCDRLRPLLSDVKTPLIGYALIVVLMFFGQGKLVFMGSMMQAETPPAHRMPRGVYIDTLHTRADNESFRIVIAEPLEKKKTKKTTTTKTTSDGGGNKAIIKGIVLFFGGNAETLPALIHRCRLLQRGYDLLCMAPEMPGYGKTPGPISVATWYDVAEQAARAARARSKLHQDVPVFAIGSSLGTFSAAHLAAHGLVDAIVLHAPLTSLVDIAASLYWWLPVRFCLREAYRFETVPANAQRIREANRVRALIIHGDADEIVAYSSGQRVHAALGPGISTFITAKGYGHNNVPLDVRGPFGKQIKTFLFDRHDR
jgi:pimeloyl-ACP methyl ester carboxylesterase